MEAYEGTPPPLPWCCPVVWGSGSCDKGFESRSLEKSCREFMVLGGSRCGLFLDGDHPMTGGGGMGAGRGGGGRWLRTQSVDAYIGNKLA